MYYTTEIMSILALEKILPVYLFRKQPNPVYIQVKGVLKSSASEIQ